MGGYTKDGIEIFHAYDINGNYLNQAYDINGNEIFHRDIPEGKEKLSVMSYNVQYFIGINSQLNMQREILNKNKPLIISCQELTRNGVIPDIGQAMLSEYPIKYLTPPNSNRSDMGIASKLELYDSTIIDFQTQDPHDWEAYHAIRDYIKTYFYFNSKRICFINTHLSYHIDYTIGQIDELLDAVSNEEYFILMGDFNTNVPSFTSDYYYNTYKKFVDKGYNLVNSSPKSGITKTYTSRPYAELLTQFLSATDCIIVSSNIDIYSTNFDTTKLFYLNGDAIDHIPVCATLLI